MVRVYSNSIIKGFRPSVLYVQTSLSNPNPLKSEIPSNPNTKKINIIIIIIIIMKTLFLFLQTVNLATYR